MSTRSVIAVAQSDSWQGRYCHWDGYPNGVGHTLWHAYHDVFGGDLARMLHLLTVEHTSWSAIVGQDFRLPPGQRTRDDMDRLCTCGRKHWEHYAQYYPEHGLPEPSHPANHYGLFDHRFDLVPIPEDKRPECDCHDREGKKDKEDYGFIRREGDSWGTEYAYVFDIPTKTMSIERITRDEQGVYQWVPLWSGSLEGEEPDWEELNEVPHTIRFFGM